jgi:hypothetical protein
MRLAIGLPSASAWASPTLIPLTSFQMSFSTPWHDKWFYVHAELPAFVFSPIFFPTYDPAIHTAVPDGRFMIYHVDKWLKPKSDIPSSIIRLITPQNYIGFPLRITSTVNRSQNYAIHCDFNLVNALDPTIIEHKIAGLRMYNICDFSLIQDWLDLPA